MKYVQTHF